MKARGKINYAFTAALVLLCLVMVSASLGAGLFARYVTKDGASDNARVAGFNVRASHDSADVLIYEDKEYFDEWFISYGEKLEIYPSEKVDKKYTMIVTAKQANGTHSRYTDPIDGWSYDSTRKLYTRTIDRDKAHSGTKVTFEAPAPGTDCHIRLTGETGEKNYRYIVKVFDQSEVAVKTDIVVRFKTSDVKEISGVKPVIDRDTIKLDGKSHDSFEEVLVGNVYYTDFTFKNTDKFSANPDEYSSAAPDSTTDELNYHVLTFKANDDYKHKGIGYSGDKLQTKMIRWKVPDEPFDRTVTVTLADANFKGTYSPSVSYPNKFYPARDGGGDLIPGSYTLVVESGTVTLGSLPANTTCTFFNGTNIAEVTASTPFSAGVYTLHLTSQTAVDYDSSNKAPELSPPVEATSWIEDTANPEKYDPVKGVYTFTLPAGQKAHLNLPYGTVIKTYKWTPVESSVIDNGTGSFTLTNNGAGKRSYTLTGDYHVELKEPKDDGGNSIVDDWDNSRKDDGTYIFNTPKGSTFKFEGLPAAQKYSYVSYVEGVKGEGDSFAMPTASYDRTIKLHATPIDGQKLKINGEEVDPVGGLYTIVVPAGGTVSISNLKSGERYYYSAQASKVPVAQYTESGKTRGRLVIPAPVADGYMELKFEHISLKDAAHVDDSSGGIPYTAITGGDGTYTFDLKKDERVTFDDLPDGYTYNYEVEETVPSEEYPFSVTRSLDNGLDYDNNVISVGKTGVEFTVSVRFTQID